MTARTRFGRVLALLIVAVFIGTTFVPAAAAQSQLNVKSVGNIFVDAAGRASGQNVATTIAEANGVLTAFTSLALGAELFSSIEIDGFSQAEKIQGVGSNAIVLHGSNAIVSIYDNTNAAFRVEATADTHVRYALSENVVARVSGETRSVAELYARNGAYLGALVLLEGDGAWDGRAGWQTDARARLSAGLQASEQVVFLAKPVYVDADSYNHAVVEILAQGQLAGQVVTEQSASTETRSSVDYFSSVHTRTYASAQATLTTEVRSRAEASAVMAYDLAYETLGAAKASDIAVYANGKLAVRAESAAEVKAFAEQGTAAYYSIVASGRAQILASTPDFSATAQHTLTVATTASGSARTQTQAMAEARAVAESRIEGAFELHGNGKLTGEFVSSIVAQSEASIHHFTSLNTRTEVFKQVRLEGDSFLRAQGNGDARFLLEGKSASVILLDDAYGTMVMEAKGRAEAVFELSSDVKATLLTENVARIEGPNAYAGLLVITQAQASANANARADAAAQTTSRFVADAQGNLRAKLEGDAKLILRSSAQTQSRAYASEEIVARAVADAKIGAQVLAGFKGSAIATSSVEYVSGVNLDVVSEAKGSFEMRYETKVESATAFVFDSRSTALPAKGAADVLVLVDGKKAVAVGSAEAALRASAEARYFVESNLDGSLRILVNTAADVRHTATVEIQSKLAAEARARSNTDAFGTFKMFYDGTAVGSFVSLKTNANAGVVSDFTMLTTGTTLFSSIVAGSSAFVSAGAEGSSKLVLENKESSLEVTDTTNAWMRMVAKAEHDSYFTLSSNVEAVARSASVVELAAENGAFLGSMIITDVEGKAATSSYFATDVSNQIRAHLEAGAQIVFRTHVGVETELSAQQRTMMNHAIAAGRVAGHVLVQTQASISAAAHAQAHAQAQAQANAHAEAQAQASASAEAAARASGEFISHAEAAGRVTTAITANYYSGIQMATAATQNRIDVTISSVSSAGKTVLISLDRDTLAAMAQGNAVILVDGQVATQAESFADVLNPENAAGASKYFVLAGEAGVQVLVSLAHFSTRTVTLKTVEESGPPLFMYTTIFLGLLVAAETVFIVRRRMA